MKANVPGVWLITDEGYARLSALFVEHEARVSAHGGKPRAEWDGDEQIDEEPPRPPYTLTGATAHIPVCGVLYSSMSFWDWLFGATTYGQICAAIGDALNDPAVAAIVLDIDSPGGEAKGCDEAAAFIRAATGRKPITAHAMGQCCSAAYWLAAATLRIEANASSPVGSIGVRCAVYDDREAMKKWGVERHNVTAAISPRKVINFDAEDPLVDIQALVDDLGEAFVGAVARYRGVTREKVVSDYGQGAVLSAARALRAGMIDAIATIALPAVQPAAPVNPAPGYAAAPTQEATMPTPNASGAIDAGAVLTALAADLGCEATPQAVAQAVAALRQSKAQAEAETAQARALATASDAEKKALGDRVAALEADGKDRTEREHKADLHAMLDRYEGGDTPRLQPGKREEMAELYGKLTVLGHTEAMQRVESVILAMPPATRLPGAPVRANGGVPESKADAMAAFLAKVEAYETEHNVGTKEANAAVKAANAALHAKAYGLKTEVRA